ncbi:MAG: hypothetical protein LBV76_02615, partial [Deltaproteobacteria bacterium]|nr:hypothetical protein [Deltaproteobacteria bacterium]
GKDTVSEKYTYEVRDGIAEGTPGIAEGTVTMQSSTGSIEVELHATTGAGGQEYIQYSDNTGGNDYVVIESTHDSIINTGQGNDTIHSGSGNDIIHSGAGNDIIYGGQGNDVMYGGEGADLFVFDRASLSNTISFHDEIKDFTLGEDRISLGDILTQDSANLDNILHTGTFAENTLTITGEDGSTMEAFFNANSVTLNLKADGVGEQTISVNMTGGNYSGAADQEQAQAILMEMIKNSTN